MVFLPKRGVKHGLHFAGSKNAHNLKANLDGLVSCSSNLHIYSFPQKILPSISAYLAKRRRSHKQEDRQEGHRGHFDTAHNHDFHTKNTSTKGQDFTFTVSAAAAASSSSSGRGRRKTSPHTGVSHIFTLEKKRKFNSWRKESLGDPGEVAMSLAASDFSRTDLESPPHVLSLLERRTNCLKLFPSFSYSPFPSFRKRRRTKKS